MKIRVFLTNDFDEEKYREVFENSVCLVIDVLRATSTMSTIINNGAKGIIVSQSKELAFGLKEKNKEYVLCGEQGGIIIDGFDYDNSPTKLSKAGLNGREAIIKTTNGTQSFRKARYARAVFSIALLDLIYTVDVAMDYIKKHNCDLIIICSGKESEISYDDTFTAGMVIKDILDRFEDVQLDDSAELVYRSAICEKDIKMALEKSISGKTCKILNLLDDLEFCSILNKHKITGKMELIDIDDEFKSIIYLKPYSKD